MTMDRFIDCLVTNNLKRLLKHGIASMKSLERAWEKIYLEYIDLSGSIELKAVFQLIKETARLESQIMMIRLCVEVLKHKHSDNSISILQQAGFRYSFDRTDQKSFIKDIDRVVKGLKSTSLIIEQNKRKIEEVEKSNAAEKLTKDHFEKGFASISKYMGFMVTPASVTVSQFVNYQKLMENEIESNKKTWPAKGK